MRCRRRRQGGEESEREKEKEKERDGGRFFSCFRTMFESSLGVVAALMEGTFREGSVSEVVTETVKITQHTNLSTPECTLLVSPTEGASPDLRLQRDCTQGRRLTVTNEQQRPQQTNSGSSTLTPQELSLYILSEAQKAQPIYNALSEGPPLLHGLHRVRLGLEPP